MNMRGVDFFIFQSFEKCLVGTKLPIIFYVDNLSATLFTKYLLYLRKETKYDTLNAYWWCKFIDYL